MPAQYSTELPFINGSVNPNYVAYLSSLADSCRASIGCLKTPLIEPWKPIIPGPFPVNPAINAPEIDTFITSPFVTDDPGFKQAIPPQGSPNPSA